MNGSAEQQEGMNDDTMKASAEHHEGTKENAANHDSVVKECNKITH